MMTPLVLLMGFVPASVRLTSISSMCSSFQTYPLEIMFSGGDGIAKRLHKSGLHALTSPSKPNLQTTMVTWAFEHVYIDRALSPTLFNGDVIYRYQRHQRRR
eukprot:m.175128 g.175128  ORF g.175128 m.175128 type:complete len:102 (+) comp31800_c0_seq2:923-1228(+)